MSKIFFMFSGQGSQKAGMGYDFFEQCPESRSSYEIASKLFGKGFLDTIFQGPEEELKKTEITQPAVMLVSYIFADVFMAEAKKKGLTIKPALVCGHSLGEYTAAAFTGTLAFQDALGLIKKRGEFIQAACLNYPGTMAAVIGFSEEKLNEICKGVSATGEHVMPVNYNSPGQIVISGTIKGVEEIRNIIRTDNPKTKVIPLKVSGAFHSMLMTSARQKMENEIAGYSFKNVPDDLVFKSAMNLEESASGDRIRTLLAGQIDNPVLWYKLLLDLKEKQYDTAIEFGPGEVLTNLLKKTVPDIKAHTVNSVDNMKKVLEDISCC